MLFRSGSTQMNGIVKQILDAPGGNLVKVARKDFSEDTLQKAVDLCAKHYGYPNTVLMGEDLYTSFSKSYALTGPTGLSEGVPVIPEIKQVLVGAHEQSGSLDCVQVPTMTGSKYVLVGQTSPDVVQFRQLLPLFWMDLPVITPARRWLLLLFGCVILFAPKKWAVIELGD